MTMVDAQDGTFLSVGHSDVTAPPHEPGACSGVSEVLKRVGDKWSVLTVMMLRDGPRRFSQLKRGVAGILQRMLTLTLRHLQRDGLVTRTVMPSIPPALPMN